MKYLSSWRALPFRKKTFVFIATATIITVLAVEFVLEPIVEGNFSLTGGDIDWHEVPLWIVAVFGQALVCATIVTRAFVGRLDRLARATDRIALGDLSARVDESGGQDDVFSRLSRSINTMAETIQGMLADERRLLSDISHELRSPLARVNASVELMAMDGGGTGNAAHLRRIENELGHMNRLVGVLLEQGRNRLTVRNGRERVDVGALAEDLADGFRMQGMVRKRTLAVSIAPGLHVDAHPMQIRVIIENLLANAMFYAPEDSVVELDARNVGGLVRLSVGDRGPGIPESELQDIFKPFYRVDASRARHSGGVGLGLTLVWEASTALGGSIRAENRHPGLLVTVDLPRAGE